MRVLSLTQPWASLWVAGAKRVETRSWPTSYRGRVAVHATLQRPDDGVCYASPFRAALTKLGFDTPADLPLGALLGWVTVNGCLRMQEHHVDLVHDQLCLGIGCTSWLGPTERRFGFYAPGRFAWTTGPERFVAARPIYYRGGQGLRNLPDAVAELLAL